MKDRILGLLAALTCAGLAACAPQAQANDRQHEQDAARRAMLDGQVMPFSVIKRRTERMMQGADYLGSEFDRASNSYRLKYVRDGRVVWIDVDGRTGHIRERTK